MHFFHWRYQCRGCERPERGVGDIHSCAYDLLLFDRAIIGGKLIGEEQLHPTTAGDEYSIECIQIIITAAL